MTPKLLSELAAQLRDDSYAIRRDPRSDRSAPTAAQVAAIAGRMYDLAAILSPPALVIDDDGAHDTQEDSEAQTAAIAALIDGTAQGQPGTADPEPTPAPITPPLSAAEIIGQWMDILGGYADDLRAADFDPDRMTLESLAETLDGCTDELTKLRA